MGCLGNILWFIFGGCISGLSWCLAGCLWCVTIIGIPVGLQCFKLASLSFFPFGKEVRYGGGAVSFLVNLIWLVLSGLPLALEHALIGLLLCVTVIGISLWPPAVQAGQAGPDALWSGVRQNADIVTEKVCPGEKFSCSTESHRKFFPGHKRKRWKRGFSFLQILKQNIDESRVLWYSRRANGRARSFFYAQKHEEKPEKI